MLNNLIRNLAPPLSIEGGEEEGDGGYRKLYQGRSVTIEVGKQEAVAAAATFPPPLFSACNSVNSVVRIDTHTQCRAQSEGEHKGAGFKGGAEGGALFNVLATALQMSAILSRFEYTQQKRKWANNSTEGKAKNKKKRNKKSVEKKNEKKKTWQSQAGQEPAQMASLTTQLI